MSKVRRSALAGLLAVGLLATAGCGESDDDGSEEDTGGAEMQEDVSEDTGQKDAGMSDADGESTLPEGFSFASSYKMRFSEFAFSDDSPGADANIFLEDFLDQSREFPIVVLLHLKKIDAEAETAKLRGGAGLKVDKQCAPTEMMECQYKWDPMSEEKYSDIELDSETGEITGGLDRLDFVGTTQFESGETEKFILPINDITFSEASLRPVDDGVKIEGATLKGYVTKEAADKAVVKLSSGSDGIKISALLDPEEMNHDVDGDGTNDAWWLSATFTARETRIKGN